MGQQDIVELLEQNPDRWFSASELRRELGVSGKICKPLKGLRYRGDVAFCRVPGRNSRAKYVYKHKRP